MHVDPMRIYILLGITHSSLNNVKVRCVEKDEYVYDSYVRNIIPTPHRNSPPWTDNFFFSITNYYIFNSYIFNLAKSVFKSMFKFYNKNNMCFDTHLLTKKISFACTVQSVTNKIKMK